MSDISTSRDIGVCPSDTDLVSPSLQNDAAHRRLPFVIKRHGDWLYQGSSVKRKEMVCMFASMLQRDKEGRFWLRTPCEAGEIEVEDAPFVAVELKFEGSCGRYQTLSFRTNVDEIVFVNAQHPLIVNWHHPLSCESAPIPYLQVRKGEGEFPILARLTRAVYFELLALAVPGLVGSEPCMGVWSDNCFFPLGPSLA